MHVCQPFLNYFLLILLYDLAWIALQPVNVSILVLIWQAKTLYFGRLEAEAKFDNAIT